MARSITPAIWITAEMMNSVRWFTLSDRRMNTNVTEIMATKNETAWMATLCAWVAAPMVRRM